jgi:hypothetical protein
LFVDSEGFYCSSENCNLCIASGIFYREPVMDIEDEEEFLKVANQVKKCSQMAGYRVLEDKA